MDISVPTIVPSLVVGTTSTVTTFKEPPKNSEAMFDFAVAGPLAGVLASIVALVVGSQLTLTSDPATLPALPLEILRQSTLGGGIIDGIIQGSLYIPDGAPMSGIMISLHPLAMAGYISLIINALALVPVGSKFASVKASCWLFCWLC
jgi:membrane-associated protease RseP (regulator of RpoE activity)